MNDNINSQEREKLIQKNREDVQQVKNARRNAIRVAKKYNITKICDNCGSTEECILSFKDENVINNNPTNLYYLCNPCFQEKKTKGARKKEDYAKCSKCNKIRIFAPSLFDGNPVCEKCCKEQLIENEIDPHMILIPIKFRKNGFPETPMGMWFDKRQMYRFNLSKENKTLEELEQSKKFVQEVHARFIDSAAKAIHENCTITKIKTMYDSLEGNDRSLFLNQLMKEDKTKLLQLIRP